MNIMTTATTLPFGPFYSSGQDISLAAERVQAAKNLVLPWRARCLGSFRESLNLEARLAHSCPSPLEGGALYHGRRDSFRHPGCAAAVRSWHRRGHEEAAVMQGDVALDHGKTLAGVGKGYAHDSNGNHAIIATTYRSPARSDIGLTRQPLLAFPAALFFRMAEGTWLIPSWTTIFLAINADLCRKVI